MTFNMKKIRKLNNGEVAAFCGQFSVLLPAGVTPYDSIRLMAKDAASAEGKAVLDGMAKSIVEGRRLHEAVEDSGVFPAYVTSMILLGEETGRLDIIMEKLANYYDRRAAVSESLKGSLSYPVIMICLMLVILSILLTRILPIFNQVFMLLGSELAGSSLRLLQAGAVAQSVSGVCIALFALSCAAVLILYGSPRGKAWLRTRLHTWRITKSFFLGIAYGRFADALSIITASGIDIYRGLDIADSLIDNKVMTEKIKICREALLHDAYLHDAVKNAEIFQAQQQRMLQAGSCSGKLDSVLEKISRHYEEAAINRIQKILAAIEPTLVIMFSLAVGLVLMSVVMPLIGIMSGI